MKNILSSYVASLSSSLSSTRTRSPALTLVYGYLCTMRLRSKEISAGRWHFTHRDLLLIETEAY
ncbi:hypothetical protein CUMW_006480 [Citrus unshiu]|nr:hypothetical protein CUMW_006480 [Citrus unshiu]